MRFLTINEVTRAQHLIADIGTGATTQAQAKKLDKKLLSLDHILDKATVKLYANLDIEP